MGAVIAAEHVAPAQAGAAGWIGDPGAPHAAAPACAGATAWGLLRATHMTESL